MDRDELTALIRVHQAGLYRYVRYLGADAATAEDLAQDTFLVAFRTPPSREPGTPAYAGWLRGVARNLFLQWCRRSRANPVHADSEAVERAEAAWTSTFLREGDGFDYVEALRACVESLSKEHRRVLQQRYTEKQSRTQMAESAGMSRDGVKSLLRRIRGALAECIRRRLKLERA